MSLPVISMAVMDMSVKLGLVIKDSSNLHAVDILPADITCG